MTKEYQRLDGQLAVISRHGLGSFTLGLTGVWVGVLILFLFREAGMRGCPRKYPPLATGILRRDI